MRFKEWLAMEEFVGKGLNGVVFSDNEDKVVKITTNKHEAELAKWLKKHPHKNIAKIFSVTQSKKGWKIVIEKVDTDFSAAYKLESFRKNAQKQGYNTPTEIAFYLEKNYQNKEYITDIVSALRHIIGSGMRLTDFLNPRNMGLNKGVIKLFDFQ